ncbi:MAG: hypothetical protein Q8Q96_00580 [bacterium]|nr:hypothetical protein [bacterium]
MIKEAKLVILQTLAYSDVFDYPLKEEELWRFLIAPSAGSGQVSRRQLKEKLDSSPSVIKYKDGFYCFSQRAHIIEKRKRKEKISQEKFAILKKAIFYLRLIPTVQLLGISGALAMKNADKDDDIDLFVIAKKNKLWMTRAFLVIILELLGLRRRRKEKNTANKICLNMLIDEAFLSLSKEKQDLYGAHEVVQMLPLFERNNTYTRFITANLWVKNFLPNGLDIKILKYKDIKGSKSHNLFEFFAKILQLWYMKKHQTTEVISDGMLAFHPFDYRKKILKVYNQRLRKYQII